MIILPHSVDLRFNKRPLISYAIIMLCLFVYFFQAENNQEIEKHLNTYCESVYSPSAKEDSLDSLSSDIGDCMSTLQIMHEREDHGIFETLRKQIQVNEKEEYTEKQTEEIFQLLHEHLERFKNLSPSSLDGALMHYPDELNPIPMITSSIAHADWEHVIFNLIFFIAFAPALEVLINNKLKYSGLLIALSLVTSISYSLTVFVAGDAPVPSLGLSGVVMGMIGLSAYLMPHARIKVFIWFITVFKNVYIPAWVLAAWYIGFDTWDMLTNDDYAGVNLVSHVSGGIAGYIFGFLWFKETKSVTSDELADEIEYQRAERVSGATFASYSGGRRELKNRQQQKEFQKQQDDYMQTLHRYVRANKDSSAIALMLTDYGIKSASPVIYEELFDRMKLWGDSRALLCLGRLIINILIQQRKYARALLFVEQCQAVTNEFVLADPENVLLLAVIARDSQQYQLAYLLVHDAENRYGDYIDFEQCALLEVELLWQYLGEQEKAQIILKNVLEADNSKVRGKAIELAKIIMNTSK